MINLSLDELRLIAQVRNISDYENKSKGDLIKVLSEPKPTLKPKPTPTLKSKPTAKPKPKIKTRINKKKLEEIKKDFYELRHKFSKNEADKYRKALCVIKNYKHLSESEIKKTGKNLTELKKA